MPPQCPQLQRQRRDRLEDGFEILLMKAVEVDLCGG